MGAPYQKEVGPSVLESTLHDAHVHLWSDPPAFPELVIDSSIDAGPVNLLPLMDELGVGYAAVITPSAMGWDNSASLAAARAYPDRLIAVGRVDLESTSSARTIEDEISSGMRGIRVSTGQGDGTGWLDVTAEQVWSVVAAAGIPVALHVRPEQLGAVARLAAAHPELTLLLDHLGRPDVAAGAGDPGFRAVLALAKYPNVSVKTPNASYFSRVGPPYGDLAPFVAAALDAFGASRVVWGSDWPLCARSAHYRDSLEPLRSVLGEYASADRQSVLRGNFERLYPCD